MKLKSTLWALAFACAAVSCSDDIEGGPNGNNGNGEAAETAKVNVMISTDTGTATKAAGENGDDNEIGSENEYAVKDVTLILFKQDDQNSSSELTELKGSYKLVAAGWTDKIGQMTPGDATTGEGTPGFPNSRMTTVEIQVKSGESILPESGTSQYGVLAITNLGETSGENLVSKVGAASNGYSTVNDLDKAVYADQVNSNFVMSSHTLQGKVNNSNVNSIVTFTSDPSVIPSTTVFVERLSAKIRITAHGSDNPTFTYKVGAEGTNDTDKDEVVLTDVAIVNQLNSNSYLLKRVSTVMGSGETDLGTTNTTDVLLGDELATTNAPIVGNNFVIDPWTRNKLKDKVSNINSVTGAGELSSKTLSYINGWTASTFGELWNTYNTNNKTTELSVNNLNNGKLDLCYTQENTTSIAGSLKGYNTGALFKATYYPKKLVELNTTNDAVEAKDVTYGNPKTGKTFYTFNNIKFKDYNAILAYIIGNAKVENVNYGTFADATTNIELFKGNILKLKNVADPFGYIAAMVAEAEKTTGASYQTPDAFLNSFNPSSMTEDKKKAFYQNVQTYTNGVCYYEYWIHHASNDNANKISPMDIAIVRNNIYDMTVTQINNLGSSEVDPTDPTEPSEDTGLKIMVNLYVKNWVVRNNGNIHF